MVEWESVLLEDVAAICDGLHGTPLYDDNGQYFFINGNNLRNGKIAIDENTKRVNERAYESLYRELLKTSVFRSFPIKNACFAARRARNCKGTDKNNRFLEVPYIDFTPKIVFMSINGTIGNVTCFLGERITIGKSVAYFKTSSKAL